MGSWSRKSQAQLSIHENLENGMITNDDSDAFLPMPAPSLKYQTPALPAPEVVIGRDAGLGTYEHRKGQHCL